jgi:hypothetical protein
MPSNTNQSVSVECSLCGNIITSKSNLTFDDGDYFCNECIMTVECRDCGTDLTITKKRASEVSGELLCTDCATKSNSEDNSNGSNNESGGTGIIRRTIRGFALYLGLGVLAMGVGIWYVALTGGVVFGPKHEAFTKILVPIIIIGYLIFK